MSSSPVDAILSRKLDWLPSITLAVLIVVPPGINLSQYWLHNPLYGYGAWTPLLVAFLLWQRGFGVLPAGEIPLRRGALLIIAAYFAAVPFLRIGQVANPDWRLLDWLLAGGAVAGLLALVWRLGGARLLVRWWFPVCLLLTAAPWSTSAERALTDAASPRTAAIASELLWTAGLPAVDEGLTLRTPVGPVSVGEDCSGIRGVQLALIAALFWSAFFRLRPWRTAALLFCGIALALLLNVLRVAVIAGTAIYAGRLEAGERLHDPAAAGAQLLLILGLPAMAMLMRAPSAPSKSEGNPAASGRNRWAAVSGKAAMVAAAWLMVSEVAVEAWFRLREPAGRSRPPHWIVRHPPPIAGIAEQPLPAQIREAYRYSDGLSMTWREGSGDLWTLLWLDFDAGKLSACTHNVHRPGVCLPTHDCTLVREFPDMEVLVGDEHLLLHHQLYRRGLSPLHLFYATVEETADETRTVADWTFAGRLSVAWRGIRGQRSEMIHLLAETASPTEEVRKAAQEYLKKLLLRAP